ncbi:MAG: acyl--CoA ligase, partial [Burkholderiales bacterium]
MNRISTLAQLLSRGADDGIAIAAPLRASLTFGGLREQVELSLRRLRESGIKRNDRVAMVLPNGPEMAAAFLGIASAATAAPLNPGYRAEEFEFYLSDLHARRLIVEEGSQSPAIAVAAMLAIPVLRLRVDANQPAGAFDLIEDGERAGSVTDRGSARTGVQADVQEGGHEDAQPGDTALVLHTSGTTSRPKIVPLSQRNICASALNIGNTLALRAGDRGLIVMPLFHIHGLIAAVLAPLAAGGSVYCTPGFNALKFFNWMEDAKPTWYTAVPTMHQALLGRAERNREIIAAHPLRFIRSSSSSLPPQVLHELEKVFKTRVVESYGMTEASHQMASNLLAPGLRKPGTVGVAAGPEVAVMDESGALLQNGETGEIVIRGANVTSGYENNPDANSDAFTNGWFRTGDQGVMDTDGYLSITGRLKEIINRGGEKISPREVDDVLMDHPAVQQVVTFAMPHDKLGEDVAAAIVLREGKSATEKE